MKRFQMGVLHLSFLVELEVGNVGFSGEGGEIQQQTWPT